MKRILNCFNKTMQDDLGEQKASSKERRCKGSKNARLSEHPKGQDRAGVEGMGMEGWI
jgi:hypothetical protein